MSVDSTVRIFKYGTTAEWAASEDVLQIAEWGLNTTTGQWKTGDGETPFADLPATSETGLPDIVGALDDAIDAINDTAAAQAAQLADLETQLDEVLPIEIADFASGLRPVTTVAVLPTLPHAGYPQGALVFLTTDNKLYRSTGSAWTTAVPTSDLSGQITTTQITDDAITTPKLFAGAVTTDELAAGAVTAAKVGANEIGAQQMVVSSWHNLIWNAGLEQDTTTTAPFSVNNGALANITTSRSGARALQWTPSGSSAVDGFYCNGAPAGGVAVHTSAVEGDSFYFEFWARSASGSSKPITASIRFCNAAGSTLATVSSTAAAATTTYTRFSVTASTDDDADGAEAPAGTAYAVFLVRCSASATNTAIYFDDFYAYQQMQGRLLVDGSIIARHIGAGEVVTEHLNAHAVTTDKLVVASRDNLITNPSVEQDTGSTDIDPFSVNNGTLTNATTAARSGTQHLTWTPSGSSAVDGVYANGLPAGGVSIHTPASVTDQFYFEFYARSASGSSKPIKAAIRFYSRAGSVLATTESSASAATTTYARYSTKATAPANTAYVVFLVTCSASATNTAIYLDDFYARRMNSGELIIDGTITATQLAAISLSIGKYIESTDYATGDGWRINADGTMRIKDTAGDDLTMSSDGLVIASSSAYTGPDKNLNTIRWKRSGNTHARIYGGVFSGANGVLDLRAMGTSGWVQVGANNSEIEVGSSTDYISLSPGAGGVLVQGSNGVLSIQHSGGGSASDPDLIIGNQAMYSTATALRVVVSSAPQLDIEAGTGVTTIAGGTTTVSEKLVIPEGSAAAPGIGVSGFLDTGVYRSASFGGGGVNGIGFVANGTGILGVSNDGYGWLPAHVSTTSAANVFMTLAGRFTRTTSSIDVKRNLEPLSDSLAVLERLERAAVSFEALTDDVMVAARDRKVKPKTAAKKFSDAEAWNPRRPGFIAEYVAEADPALGQYDEETGKPTYFQTDGILAYVVAGLNELRRENETLRERVAELEGKAA